MWREKNIYFTEHDIYFTKLMFILKNINLELKSALRTKYIFYRILLYTAIKYQDVELEFRILWRKIAPNPIKSGVDTGENNVALKKVRRL